MPAKTSQLSGLLVIDKSPGLTSHDVVARIRRLLQSAVKVGHTGTLDPFATGVLLVAIGQATRLIEYTHEWDKEYEATLTLGATSDTDDGTGKISKSPAFAKGFGGRSKIQNPNQIQMSQIQNYLKQFVGTTKQIPPDYSAVKIKGQKAYDLVRRGKAVQLKPRSVIIHKIEIISYDYPQIHLRVTCGTGTYIRSLARDLGSALGAGAYVETLRRTRIGQFAVKQSCQLDELTATNLSLFLHKVELLVNHLPSIIIADTCVSAFNHGQSIKIPLARRIMATTNEPLAVYNHNHVLLGTAIITSPNKLVPQKTLSII